MMRVHLALVQCLHERVQLLELGAGVSLQLDTLLSYSGRASCRWISTAQYSTVQYSTVQLQVDQPPGRHGGEVRAGGLALGAEGGLGGGPGAGVAGRPACL